MFSIADETLFQRLLSLERRRCERTEERFALLLIDLEDITSSTSDLETIGRAIGNAMRDTDFTGWYQHPAVLGVILTTLNGSGRETIEPIMLERIRAAMAPHVESDQIQRVRISCHIFPEDGIPNRIFYSDHDKKQNGNPAVLKRAMDLAGSVAALLILSPLFAVIAVLVKLTSPGPVFFRQKRIGQFGGEFTFLKFRSMYVNSDPSIHKEFIRDLIAKKVEPGRTYKITNDPRITSIGRILRKSSLDELPQFINVLKGDMSLVGPRPPIPYEFEHYSLWHRRRIVEAKPGITGDWQVHGRSRTTFDEMVRMDLRYIRNQSLWLDLKLLMKTPFVMISGDGAY